MIQETALSVGVVIPSEHLYWFRACETPEDVLGYLPEYLSLRIRMARGEVTVLNNRQEIEKDLEEAIELLYTGQWFKEA